MIRCFNSQMLKGIGAWRKKADNLTAFGDM